MFFRWSEFSDVGNYGNHNPHTEDPGYATGGDRATKVEEKKEEGRRREGGREGGWEGGRAMKKDGRK